MRNVWLLPFAVLLVTASACAAKQTTWTGKISDELCGGTSHMWDEHSPVTDEECTLQCVRAGRKYVFVANDTVYVIQDQKDPLLAEHAGTVVRLTGQLKDNTITVARMEAVTRP